jgi:uncharacterized protein (TIGR03067 family)
VTWLADSTGFYFTGGKDYNKLLYFDVAAKKARVVVADFKGTTHWPAVSRDGQRVAVVAAVVHDKGIPQFQVVVYDSTGKELQRSQPISARPRGRADSLPVVWLFWAPKDQGDKVLVEVRHTCCLVDLKANRFADLGDQALWVFGNSPIRPDGQGFLTYGIALKGATPICDPTFHEWSGKKWPIKLPDAWSGAERADPWILPLPCLYSSRWEKGVAVVRGTGMELTVDTFKLGMAVQSLGRPKDAALLNQFRFGKAGATVRVTAPVPPPKKVISFLEPLSVEVSAPGAAPKELFWRASAAMLQPSPDGKLLAIRCLTNKQGSANEATQVASDCLIVLNAQGEVLANLEVGAIGPQRGLEAEGAKTGDAKALTVARELERLEGTWAEVTYEMMGRKVDRSRQGPRMKLVAPRAGGPSSWTINPPKLAPKKPLSLLVYSLEMAGNPTVATGILTVDPAKTPKIIVVRFTFPNHRKDESYAYVLKGDELRVCFSSRGGPPTEMTSTEQNLQTLITYRRVPAK